MGVAQKGVLSFATGDQSPPISIQYFNRGKPATPTTPAVPKTPRDLSAYTAKLSFRVSATRVVVRDADMSQAAEGIVEFDWGPTDLDTVGTYDAQITLIDNAGRAQTWNVLVISVYASTRS